MSALLHQVYLSTPLFILVFIGYGVMRWAHWPKVMSDSLSRFVFFTGIAGDAVSSDE